jgi:hypothetical protein
MSSQTPREPRRESRVGSVSEDASHWIRNFVKTVEIEFHETSAGLAADAGIEAYQNATIVAVLRALLESGMELQSVVEGLNPRRAELIDKHIQGTLTEQERREFDVLQRAAETYRDVMAPSMEGARALRQSLRENNPGQLPNE